MSHSVSFHPILSLPVSSKKYEKYEKYETSEHFSTLFFKSQLGFLKQVLSPLFEMPNVSAFGPTPAEALIELKAAWELMKECYQEDGVPVPNAPSRKKRHSIYTENKEPS